MTKEEKQKRLDEINAKREKLKAENLETGKSIKESLEALNAEELELLDSTLEKMKGFTNTLEVSKEEFAMMIDYVQEKILLSMEDYGYGYSYSQHGYEHRRTISLISKETKEVLCQARISFSRKMSDDKRRFECLSKTNGVSIWECYCVSSTDILNMQSKLHKPRYDAILASGKTPALYYIHIEDAIIEKFYKEKEES